MVGEHIILSRTGPQEQEPESIADYESTPKSLWFQGRNGEIASTLNVRGERGQIQVATGEEIQAQDTECLMSSARD